MCSVNHKCLFYLLCISLPWPRMSLVIINLFKSRPLTAWFSLAPQFKTTFSSCGRSSTSWCPATLAMRYSSLLQLRVIWALHIADFDLRLSCAMCYDLSTLWVERYAIFWQSKSRARTQVSSSIYTLIAGWVHALLHLSFGLYPVRVSMSRLTAARQFIDLKSVQLFLRSI